LAVAVFSQLISNYEFIFEATLDYEIKLTYIPRMHIIKV